MARLLVRLGWGIVPPTPHSTAPPPPNNPTTAVNRRGPALRPAQRVPGSGPVRGAGGKGDQRFLVGLVTQGRGGEGGEGREGRVCG